jgi:peptidyl-prolyl cis-trans isomerase SurA
LNLTKLLEQKWITICFYNKSYKEFVDETVINYEDGNLESKYPEFRNLLKEYRDGILLFDLTDQKVWSKAVKDTAGLKAFYEKNKNNLPMGRTRRCNHVQMC